MEIGVFSTKRYDRESLTATNTAAGAGSDGPVLLVTPPPP